MSDLEIREIKSNKNKIKNPPRAETNIIPRLGTSCIFNGTTGMGKSTLMTNLLTQKRFYPMKTFTHRFLISPTAEGDDVQKALKIPRLNTFTNLKEAPYYLKIIMDAQKKKIKKKGSHKAPQILIIYDDVISDPLFMRTDEFIKSFIASRHYNLTVMLATQSWTACPRRCRIQARNIFFFAAPLSEVEKLCEEHCPPRFTKQQFFLMVAWATDRPYSFLYINKSVPMQDRFRKNLDQIINLDVFRNLTTKDSAKSYQEKIDQILNINQSKESVKAKSDELQTSKRRCLAKDDEHVRELRSGQQHGNACTRSQS